LVGHGKLRWDVGRKWKRTSGGSQGPGEMGKGCCGPFGIVSQCYWSRL
jgi:hypothetical protein